MLICSHEEKKQKRVGLGTGTTKKTNIKYIFMRGAWTLFNAEKKKKGKLEKKKKKTEQESGIANSPCIPEGALWYITVLTFQGYLFWGGFSITPLDKLANI